MFSRDLTREWRQQMKQLLTPPPSHDGSSTFHSLTVAKCNDRRFISFFLPLTGGGNEMSESPGVGKMEVCGLWEDVFVDLTVKSRLTRATAACLRNDRLNIASSFWLIRRQQTH